MGEPVSAVSLGLPCGSFLTFAVAEAIVAQW